MHNSSRHQHNASIATPANSNNAAEADSNPLQNALMDQIKNMIKNGNKHFEKEAEREQMVEEMRNFLQNMANSYGEMPKQYDTTSIFNQMI